MASGKSYFSRQSYRFLSTERDNSITPEPLFEFDEADVWNSNSNNSVNSSSEFKKSVIPTSRIGKKKSMKKMDYVDGGTAKSLPMNVPDWSKILKEEYKGNGRRNMDQDDVDDDDDDDDVYNGKVGKIPPHEYLMARQMGRTQAASFSVHEGRGRTLKGRDLSRVRNAIWEKTGFED
ncbi:hypothetical protein AQUCO_03000163v1 [Aquilegia coerulea]|uniref:Senescence regulator n=1 Tax=Aquilegia coerulea TaxID=218851 RepID=A0A2G5D1J3_AQUCA|nr:hypothetical protein AQUCO_03000163v1 [Aquilegia coerulea]